MDTDLIIIGNAIAERAEKHGLDYEELLALFVALSCRYALKLDAQNAPTLIRECLAIHGMV